MRMEMTPQCEPSLRQHLRAARSAWPDSVFICVFLATYYGAAFIVEAIHRSVPSGSTWSHTPRPMLVGIGALFIAMAVFAVTKPRSGGYICTFVVCIVGIAAATHPFNITALGTFAIILAVATWATYVRELVLRWAERLGDE